MLNQTTKRCQVHVQIPGQILESLTKCINSPMNKYLAECWKIIKTKINQRNIPIKTMTNWKMVNLSNFFNWNNDRSIWHWSKQSLFYQTTTTTEQRPKITLEYSKFDFLQTNTIIGRWSDCALIISWEQANKATMLITRTRQTQHPSTTTKYTKTPTKYFIWSQSPERSRSGPATSQQ